MKNSLPPLADDVYTFICHGRGSKRERYIVRNGETLNRALVQNGKESLQWAYLPVPAGMHIHFLSASCKYLHRHVCTGALKTLHVIKWQVIRTVICVEVH